MNKELRAAQDQLDRAAKRGWSRAGGMLPYTLNQDGSSRIYYLWNFTNVYHPVYVFFRHRETLRVFNNLLMLRQTIF